jgi:hypothetical protein
VTFTYQDGGNGGSAESISAVTEGVNDNGFVFNGHCDFDGCRT